MQVIDAGHAVNTGRLRTLGINAVAAVAAASGNPRLSLSVSWRFPLGELVGADGEEAVFGADGGELRKGAFNFLPDATQGNAEDALAALEEVDDFSRGEILLSALTDFPTILP